MKPTFNCTIIVDKNLQPLAQLAQRGLKEYFDFQINQSDRTALVDGFGLDSAPIALNRENSLLMDSVTADPYIISCRDLDELCSVVESKATSTRFLAMQPIIIDEILEKKPECINETNVIVVKKPIGKKDAYTHGQMVDIFLGQATETHEYKDFTIFSYKKTK